MMLHVQVEKLLERLRTEGVHELDLVAIRALIGTALDTARRPSPPESIATTQPETPTAIRRSGSSQRIKAIVVDESDDDD